MDQVSISASQFHTRTVQNVKIVQPGEGINLWVFGILVTLKALGNKTGYSYSVYEVIVPPGLSIPRLIQTQEEEACYMLDGELMWIVGDQEFHATKGSFVHVPHFVPRAFVNKINRTTCMLCSCTPSGFENYFLNVGKVVTDLDSTPPEYSEDKLELDFKIAEEYGIAFRDHQEIREEE